MGANLLERDEDGWRIPRPGTKSRGIYDLARDGVKPQIIAKMLNMSPGTVRVLLCHMRNPGPSNAFNRQWARDKWGG